MEVKDEQRIQFENEKAVMAFEAHDRRSMSMLNPSEQAQLNAFLFDKTAKTFEEQLQTQAGNVKRPTIASFYEGRPQNNIFLETAHEQEARVRNQSVFGHLKTWRLLRVIVKSNDDVRQEQFAMQLIQQIDHIFKLKKINLWLRPYEILATG